MSSVHADFATFMRDAVLPCRKANPTALRLDLAPSGGNRTVFGRFAYGGRTWRVHSDTHFAPLRVAHEALQANPGADLFVEEPTPSGACLALAPELRARYASPYKHLYIYED